MIERACAPDPLAKRGGNKGKGGKHPVCTNERSERKIGASLAGARAKPLSQPGRHAGRFNRQRAQAQVGIGRKFHM